MWKFNVLVFVILGTGIRGFAQEELLSDTTKMNQWIYFSKKNRNNDLYHQLLRFHDPYLYLSGFPHFTPVKDRLQPLKDGEGKNGYWLEGNVAHRIVMYKGKYYTDKSWKRKTRFTFDANFLIRMTRDNSSPLLPGNNVIGLGMDYLITPLRKIETSSPNFWVTIQAHHYSNGQKERFFDSTIPLKNNYLGGDFSTNYIRVVFYRAKITYLTDSNVRISSASIGLQRDGSLVGPFLFSDEQRKYYGQGRILSTYQYMQKPQFLYTNERVEENSRITSFKRVTEWGVRLEASYIFDNLTVFPGDNKYRLSLHSYSYIMPWVTNKIGFMVHTYFGRDYLNVRFDDVVATIQGGVILKM